MPGQQQPVADYYQSPWSKTPKSWYRPVCYATADSLQVIDVQ